MSGLIKFKFRFENHLKIYFEKLEKKKRKGKSFSFGFQPRARLGLLARGPLPPPASAPAWAEPRRGLPAQFARAASLSH
jgi:hypothetical protein